MKWQHPINRRIRLFCTIAPISLEEVDLDKITRARRHRAY